MIACLLGHDWQTRRRAPYVPPMPLVRERNPEPGENESHRAFQECARCGQRRVVAISIFASDEHEWVHGGPEVHRQVIKW